MKFITLLISAVAIYAASAIHTTVAVHHFLFVNSDHPTLLAVFASSIAVGLAAILALLAFRGLLIVRDEVFPKGHR